MFPRRFLWWVALAALIASPNTAFAAGKSVKVCNQTGRLLLVAVGWLDYGFPAATGFYNVPNDTCSRILVPKADRLLPVFAYAIDTAGIEYRPNNRDKNNFCINRTEVFEEKSTALCQAVDTAAKEIVSDWEQFNSLGIPFAEAYQWNVQ